MDLGVCPDDWACPSVLGAATAGAVVPGKEGVSMPGETTSIVIFGATGDLVRRKLIPALFTLYAKDQLPEDLQIIGLARSPFNDERFREFMWNEVREFGELAVQPEQWRAFAQRLYYCSGYADRPPDVEGLKRRLEELEAGRPANRLFYLSIAPSLYEPAVRHLARSGLASEDRGWRRVVIEKPFGQDLASAQALRRVVNEVFEERQVFHIDHYLGKETVQNILVLRFANAIFEPLWNRNYIDNVQITVAERIDIEGRGYYYDQAGVVRDMVQNHLLQLLALIAMEPPSIVDAESLRDKKVEVLRSIRHWSPEDATRNAVAGQYRGYDGEEGVRTGSITPTFAALRLLVDNWRWRGVPFYLRTGKAMTDKVSEIIIQFQYPPHMMFSVSQYQSINPNILSLCIQPDEGTHLSFELKVPGQGMRMQSASMEFKYESAFREEAIPEAYEHLLQDALNGDATDFIRTDQIEEAWRIVDPLLQAWECPGAPPPFQYEPGTWGPPAADELLGQDGRVWLQICGEHGLGHSALPGLCVIPTARPLTPPVA